MKTDSTKKKYKTVTYGYKSFTYLGAKLWNEMPTNIKNVMTITEFKERLKAWDGQCKCYKW